MSKILTAKSIEEAVRMARGTRMFQESDLARRTLFERLQGEVVTVETLAAQRDEQLPTQIRARVGRYANALGVTSEQAAAADGGRLG